MTAKSPDRYHLRGWTADGRRVNRHYKTKVACDKMIAKMRIVDCALLIPISWEVMEAALREMETENDR